MSLTEFVFFKICEPAEINTADSDVVYAGLRSWKSPGEQSSPCLDFLWQLLPVCFLFDGQHKGEEGFYLTRQIFMRSRKVCSLCKGYFSFIFCTF